MAERIRSRSTQDLETIGAHLAACGVSRRRFVECCASMMVAAPFGLALTGKARASDVARAVAAARRPSVIWLHFQDCTGCTETLLRTSKPGLAELILHLISLDYHATIMAASGKQAEAALRDAMKENAGKYVLVCEGAIPRKDGGIYMTHVGRTAISVLEEVGRDAAAVIAMGSCASWGGIPSSGPNPTDATGVDSILTGKPIVNIPGCPPNPYTLLGTVLEYAVAGKLPALDSLKRPLFAYDRVIHDHCPRRAHFDAGRFAGAFGDSGHRQGWCLYKLGCKGPATHGGCSTRHFNELPDVWPIGIGAPCVGCTEQDVAFKIPIFQTIQIHDPKPPDTYAAVKQEQGKVSPVATALAGAIGGALVGGGLVASRALSNKGKAGSGDGEE